MLQNALEGLSIILKQVKKKKTQNPGDSSTICCLFEASLITLCGNLEQYKKKQQEGLKMYPLDSLM